MTATVSDHLTRETRIREAWEMVERAEPGDSLSVGVALDYVMDALGCEREGAKSLLYRWAAKTLDVPSELEEGREARLGSHNPAFMYVVQRLFEGDVGRAESYTSGYYGEGGGGKWPDRARRVAELCVLIEGCP
jgi:hypothetical protein